MQGKKTFDFILNNERVSETLPPGMVVLDYLRNIRRMTGTKEGCREGDCGACMVLLGRIKNGHIHYQAVNSCLLPVAELEGRHLVTIEGLNTDSLNPIQQSFLDQSASQCGFCTPGMVVSLTGFYLNSNEFSPQQAVAALDGNICRCTGYASIKRAAGLLAEHADQTLAALNEPQRIELLVEQNILPSWFLTIHDRLANLQTTAENIKPQAPPFVAGGTDLFVQQPEALLDKDFQLLTRDEKLAEIRIEDGHGIIGATVTVDQLHHSPILAGILPGLSADLKLVSSTPIRNRATIGGNIINASPIGDLSIIFLALDAELVLGDGSTQRTVPLKDFFLDYKKLDMTKNELLTEVRFSLPSDGALFNFEKVSKRTYLDIAGVNSAMLLQTEGDEITKAHISAGGVAPIPLYLRQTSRLLHGKPLSSDLINEAAQTALSEISPISDVRGTAAYKRLLLRQLLFAHFAAFAPEKVRREVLL